MKDASDVIRSWAYGVLYKTITYDSAYVDVYSFAPTDAEMPYIVIGQQTMGPQNGAKDRYMATHELMIEIWTAFDGNDVSYVPANTIADSALQLLVQRQIELTGSGGTALDGFTGFNCAEITVGGIITDTFLFNDKIVAFKSINLILQMEES